LTNETTGRVGRAKMKKRILECKIHGFTLHRCKRKYWKTAKDKIASDYKEQCFKCIGEGRYKKTSEKKTGGHVKIG